MQRVSAVLAKAKVVSDGPVGASFFGALYFVKHSFESSLAQVFAPQEASLVSGMLLGERRGLAPELEQLLVSVGLIHIVILAGYALTLVADAVGRASAFVPRRLHSFVVAAILVLYVLMIGAGASTVRAAIMALVALVARVLERPSAAMRSLAAAGTGMALWNPAIVPYDAGFAISVAATFGLIALGGPIERLLAFIPERLDLRAIAASTLSVQVFALPALLYYSGTLSLVSVPANLFALPALPYAMLFGFLAGALNFLHPALALVPTLITYALVHYILVVAALAASVPWGAATVYAFPAWAAMLLYVLLTALAINEYTRLPEK